MALAADRPFRPPPVSRLGPCAPRSLQVYAFSLRRLLMTGSAVGPIAHFIIAGYIAIGNPAENAASSPPPMGVFGLPSSRFKDVKLY